MPQNIDHYRMAQLLLPILEYTAESLEQPDATGSPDLTALQGYLFAAVGELRKIRAASEGQSE